MESASKGGGRTEMDYSATRKIVSAFAELGDTNALEVVYRVAPLSSAETRDVMTTTEPDHLQAIAFLLDKMSPRDREIAAIQYSQRPILPEVTLALLQPYLPAVEVKQPSAAEVPKRKDAATSLVLLPNDETASEDEEGEEKKAKKPRKPPTNYSQWKASYAAADPSYDVSIYRQVASELKARGRRTPRYTVIQLAQYEIVNRFRTYWFRQGLSDWSLANGSIPSPDPVPGKPPIRTTVSKLNARIEKITFGKGTPRVALEAFAEADQAAKQYEESGDQESATRMRAARDYIPKLFKMAEDSRYENDLFINPNHVPDDKIDWP